MATKVRIKYIIPEDGDEIDHPNDECVHIAIIFTKCNFKRYKKIISIVFIDGWFKLQ